MTLRTPSRPARTTSSLALEHRGVLALDDGGVDDLALHLLGGDADVGDHDLVAVGDLGRQRGTHLVVPVDLEAGRLEHVGDGERRHLALLQLLGAELEVDDLRGDDVEGQSAASDRGAAAGRQVGAVEAAADLAERARDVGRVHPVGVRLAVDGELQRSAELHGDGRAVGDGLVDRRGDQVLVGDLDTLGREHVGDGATDGADLAGLPVEGEGHVLAEGGVADRRTSDGRHDQRREGRQDGLGPAELRETRAHDSPNVVLSGPRVAAPPGHAPTAAIEQGRVVRRASGGLAGPAGTGPRAAGNRSRSRPTITRR